MPIWFIRKSMVAFFSAYTYFQKAKRVGKMKTIRLTNVYEEGEAPNYEKLKKIVLQYIRKQTA